MNFMKKLVRATLCLIKAIVHHELRKIYIVQRSIYFFSNEREYILDKRLMIKVYYFGI